MRRTRFKLAFILLGWTGAAGAVPPAHSPADAEKQLLQLERKWLASETDPKALESILADDFIHVLQSGFITKQEHIQYWRRHPGEGGGRKSFDDLRVRIFGTVGIATGIVVHESAGKIRKTAFTDVFAYRNGRWRAVNAQELLLSETN